MLPGCWLLARPGAIGFLGARMGPGAAGCAGCGCWRLGLASWVPVRGPGAAGYLVWLLVRVRGLVLLATWFGFLGARVGSGAAGYLGDLVAVSWGGAWCCWLFGWP